MKYSKQQSKDKKQFIEELLFLFYNLAICDIITCSFEKEEIKVGLRDLKIPRMDFKHFKIKMDDAEEELSRIDYEKLEKKPIN